MMTHFFRRSLENQNDQSKEGESDATVDKEKSFIGCLYEGTFENDDEFIKNVSLGIHYLRYSDFKEFNESLRIFVETIIGKVYAVYYWYIIFDMPLIRTMETYIHDQREIHLFYKYYDDPDHYEELKTNILKLMKRYCTTLNEKRVSYQFHSKYLVNISQSHLPFDQEIFSRVFHRKDFQRIFKPIQLLYELFLMYLEDETKPIY